MLNSLRTHTIILPVTVNSQLGESIDPTVIIAIVFAYAIPGFSGGIPTGKSVKAYDGKIEKDLVFVGRVSMIDPSWEEAKHDSERFKFKTA